MNETIETIRNRRSVRRYSSKPVEQEKIDTVIDAGLRAASGKNLQSSIILQIEDPELHKEFIEQNRLIGGWEEGFDPFYGAPVILVVLAKKDLANHVYDGSLSMGNMMLAAEALGLGSCWINRAKQEFDSDWGKDIVKRLGLEDEYEGIGHLALGYPDGGHPAEIAVKPGRVFKI